DGLAAAGRDEHAHHTAVHPLLQELDVAVAEDGQGAAGVEAEDLVVVAAVVRRPPQAGRGAAAEGRRSVIDGRARVVGGAVLVAGHAVGVVGLGPAPEAAELAVHRVEVGGDVLLGPADVLGDGDGAAGAVRDGADRRAVHRGARRANGDVQGAVGAGGLVAHPGGRVDVGVAGGPVVGAAVALAVGGGHRA